MRVELAGAGAMQKRKLIPSERSWMVEFRAGATAKAVLAESRLDIFAAFSDSQWLMKIPFMQQRFVFLSYSPCNSQRLEFDGDLQCMEFTSRILYYIPHCRDCNALREGYDISK